MTLAANQAAGGGAGHWTFKNGAQIIDSRPGSIPAETGNLSVVWNAAQTDVWYYLTVDSIVGNRAYFAQPRTTLSVLEAAGTAGQNLVVAALFGGVGDTALPAGVLAIIQGSTFNAAMTDILPADAKFGQNRINCGTGTTATLGCLGYGTANPNVGAAIQSSFSTSVAHPVNFNIFGTDPITGAAIPNYTVVPIGIAPIILITNRTNAAGLGQTALFSDVPFQASVQELFTGVDCAGTAWGPFDAAHNFAINPILREPLSGTMNTFEFNYMTTNSDGSTANGYFSQEGEFDPPYFLPGTFNAIQPGSVGGNPLSKVCGGSSYASPIQGTRKRVIGTGEMVAQVKANADSIGYLFFGYGNVSSISGSPLYGYLSFQGHDPINPSGSYSVPYVSGGLNYPGNGQLPTCAAPCPIAPGASFPQIRNGGYRSWSLLRGVADAGSAALADLQALAGIAANQINTTVPDFLPFNPAGGDPGFIGYRIHFAPGMAGTPAFSFNATNTPNNGITNPALEAGGDVGGCLDYKTSPNTLNCRY
jgi:ABC-type phosphate transport system substrate-binding protein